MFNTSSQSDSAGGFFYIGSVMLGLGGGLYYNNVAVGLFIGLGVGFILFGVTKLLKKK